MDKSLERCLTKNGSSTSFFDNRSLSKNNQFDIFRRFRFFSIFRMEHKSPITITTKLHRTIANQTHSLWNYLTHHGNCFNRKMV